MITALLIMMVCTVVVTASLALAVHSDGQSADQRNLTAALHAADYGLQEELANLAGQPTSSGATCTPIAASLLPNTSLPTQWFSVTMPGCTTGNLTRTIIATGYALGDGSAPQASPPATAAVRTEVAHVTLQPAGALSNGGYGFPDAVLALKGAGANQTGAILAASGNPLTVSGVNGPESIRADGPVTLSNSPLPLSSGQSTGSLSSWDNITLNSSPVTGNVVSGKTVTLNSSNVSGYVEGTTVNLGSPASTVGSSRSGTVQLPTQPPVPTFTYSSTDWLALTGGSVQTGCPGSATLSGLYVLTATCTITSSMLTPVTGYSAVAVIINATADLTLTVPSTITSSAQLYLIVTNGTLTLNGSGAAVPVFAYGAGTVKLSGAGGAIVGQIVGGNIVTSASTSLLAESVSTTTVSSGVVTFAPDFAFPAAGSGPPPTGFVPQVNDEYLCAPGVTSAC